MRTASLAGLSTIFVLLWSSGWIASHIAASEQDVITLLLHRYFIVFVALSFLVTLCGHWQRMSRSEAMQQMLVGALAHGIYLVAALSAFEQGVSAGLVAFITTLHPMLTATLSARVNREYVTGRQWRGLLLGTSAILLTVSDSYRHGASGAALALPFLAVLALTVGSLLNRHLELQHQARQEPPRPVLLVLLLQSAGTILTLLVVSGSANTHLIADYSNREWLLLLWLALVVSLGAYAVMQKLLQQISATRVASLSYLVPPATMIQAFLIFGEKLSTMDVAGLTLATAGVFLIMTPGSGKTFSPATSNENHAVLSQAIPIEPLLPTSPSVRLQAVSTRLDIEL